MKTIVRIILLLCVQVCGSQWRCPWRSEVIDPLGTRLRGNCGTSDMGAGNGTQVLYQSRMGAEVLSHRSSLWRLCVLTEKLEAHHRVRRLDGLQWVHCCHVFSKKGAKWHRVREAWQPTLNYFAMYDLCIYRLATIAHYSYWFIPGCAVNIQLIVDFIGSQLLPP